MSNLNTSIQIKEKKAELEELSKILSPYTKKMIKTGLILARVPNQDESVISYKKMSLWIDDISRFVYLTSTFSSVHLKGLDNHSLRKEIQKTNREIVKSMETISFLLKDNEPETHVATFIETNIIPLIVYWKNHLNGPIKDFINEIA